MLKERLRLTGCDFIDHLDQLIAQRGRIGRYIGELLLADCELIPVARLELEAFNILVEQRPGLLLIAANLHALHRANPDAIDQLAVDIEGLSL